MPDIKSYKFHADRGTWFWTVVHLLLYAALATALYFLYEGGYFSAWFTALVVATIALMMLSMPRRIMVTDLSIEILCILDYTALNFADIASVRRIDKERMKWTVPLFGGCGFFGYYGHYIDLRHLRHVRIYALEWNNFIEIIDRYDDRYYISCRDADSLIADIAKHAKIRISDENDNDDEQ